jgi:hypothetical protein
LRSGGFYRSIVTTSLLVGFIGPGTGSVAARRIVAGDRADQKLRLPRATEGVDFKARRSSVAVANIGRHHLAGGLNGRSARFENDGQ